MPSLSRPLSHPCAGNDGDPEATPRDGDLSSTESLSKVNQSHAVATFIEIVISLCVTNIMYIFVTGVTLKGEGTMIDGAGVGGNGWNEGVV